MWKYNPHDHNSHSLVVTKPGAIKASSFLLTLPRWLYRLWCKEMMKGDVEPPVCAGPAPASPGAPGVSLPAVRRCLVVHSLFHADRPDRIRIVNPPTRTEHLLSFDDVVSDMWRGSGTRAEDQRPHQLRQKPDVFFWRRDMTSEESARTLHSHWSAESSVVVMETCLNTTLIIQ